MSTTSHNNYTWNHRTMVKVKYHEINIEYIGVHTSAANAAFAPSDNLFWI